MSEKPKHEKVNKFIIKENGEIEIKGNFNRNNLISLLRKELQYQKKLEEIQIEKQVKKELTK